MKCAWNCQDHEIHLEFYCLCSGMSVSKIIPPRPSAFPEAPSRFLHPLWCSLAALRRGPSTAGPPRRSRGPCSTWQCKLFLLWKTLGSAPRPLGCNSDIFNIPFFCMAMEQTLLSFPSTQRGPGEAPGRDPSTPVPSL